MLCNNKFIRSSKVSFKKPPLKNPQKNFYLVNNML